MGLPTAVWLGGQDDGQGGQGGQDDGQDGKQAPVPGWAVSPLAPVGAVLLFFLLTSAPALLATVAGCADTCVPELPYCT